MSTSHFASLDAPDGPAASDYQQSRSRAATQVVASASTPAPMVGWWARHAGGDPESLSDIPALEIPEDKDLIGDTLAAFRTALRQAEDVDSAADLTDQEDAETAAKDDALDYFAPAFQRALGVRGRERTEAAEEGPAHAGEQATPTNSLDYFQASFRRALGAGDHKRSTSDAGTGPASLDYFAPSFRRVLDEGEAPATMAPDPAGADDRMPGVVERFKTIVKNASRQARLKVDGFAHSGISLDRISDCLFGTPSRDLMVNGR